MLAEVTNQDWSKLIAAVIAAVTFFKALDWAVGKIRGNPVSMTEFGKLEARVEKLESNEKANLEGRAAAAEGQYQKLLVEMRALEDRIRRGRRSE